VIGYGNDGTDNATESPMECASTKPLKSDRQQLVATIALAFACITTDPAGHAGRTHLHNPPRGFQMLPKVPAS